MRLPLTTQRDSAIPLILAGVGLLGVATTTQADLVGLDTSAERISQNNWADTDARPLWRIRVYALFSGDDDRLEAVYGDSDDPLTITTDDADGFYQSALGADTSTGINTAAVELFPSIASDSWVTIGSIDSSSNELSDIGVDWLTFNDGSATLTTDNGSWFVTQEAAQGDSDGWTDNRVLIGQFTISQGAYLSGSMNLLWKDLDEDGDFVSHLEAAVTFKQVALPEVGAADFNGDGIQDTLFHVYSTGREYVQIRNGLTASAEGYVTSGTGGWSFFDVGDFNGDGKTDLLSYNSNSNRYWVALKNGLGNHADGGGYISSNLAGWELIGLGDFNGDSTTDLLWLNTNNDKYWVALRDGFTTAPGSGYITPGLDGEVDEDGEEIDGTFWGVADLNGDAIDDIIWYTASDNRHWGDLMDAQGDVASGDYLSSGLTGWDLEFVADFNNDGNMDLLFHKTSVGRHWLALKDGVDTIDAGWASSGLEGWNLHDVADFNNDGKADIVYRNTNNGKYWVAYKDGVQNVPGGGGYINTGAPWQYTSVGDFDGDGDGDVTWYNTDLFRYQLSLLEPDEEDVTGWLREADADWLLLH